MIKNTNNLLEIIKDLFTSKLADEVIKARLDEYHSYDIAQIIIDLPDEMRESLFKLYDDEELAEILAYVDLDETEEVLEDMDPQKIASIISEMDPDDAVDLLDELPYEHAQDIIGLLDEETKTDIQELAEYGEDLAGSIMTSNFIKVLSGSDIKVAMKTVVTEAPEAETINTIFIIDAENKLLGTIELKKLIVAKTPCAVNDIMVTNFPFVEVNEHYEKVVEKIRNYGIMEMPVLENGIIKGIITMDDALDTLTEVAEEDYAKLGGLNAAENQNESVRVSIKKRIPWLITLLILDILVCILISMFENIIERVTVLVYFQAAVLGLAGNSGTQSLAVSVRRISRQALNTKNAIFKYLGKELISGLLTGLFLAVLSFALVTILLYITNDSEFSPVKIGLVVGIAVAIAVTASNLCGAAIPIIFYKCKIDPAVASGPFITTINDIVAILVYFGVAILIFKSSF